MDSVGYSGGGLSAGICLRRVPLWANGETMNLPLVDWVSIDSGWNAEIIRVVGRSVCEL